MDRLRSGDTLVVAKLDRAFRNAADALSKVDGYQLDSFIYDDRALLFRLGVESPFLTIEYPATVAYRHHQANSTGAIKHFVRGAAAICTGERHNLYPGGRALKLDRQGLIASTIASNIRWHILPNGQCGWTQKGRAILRILFSGRLFFLSGIIRQMRKKSYFRKAHEFALPP